MDEKSKPNWVDYANLASNVAQNAQLHDLHGTIKALGALQAEKARLELNEQQLREREDRLREYLWQVERVFEAFVSNSTGQSCRIYLFTKQLRDTMSQLRITTAAFRQFADKDRLGQFLKRLQQAMDETASKMGTAMRQDVETFLRYRAEASDLDSTIKRLEEGRQQRANQLAQVRKRREATVANLDILRQKAGTPEYEEEQARMRLRSSSARVAVLLLAIPTGIAWLSLIILFGVPIYDLMNDISSAEHGQFSGYGVLALLVAVGGTALCRALYLKSKAEKSVPERISSLEDVVKRAESEIARLQAERPAESALAKYGVKKLAELVQNKQDRDDFMRKFAEANGLSLADDIQEGAFIKQSENIALLSSGSTLSPEVQELARHPDRKIAAIKLYREQTGVGLAEAKEAVEAFMYSDKN